MNAQLASTYEIDIALRPLALLAAGQTGADIERLIREARSRARREGRALTWTDVEREMATPTHLHDPAMDWQIAVHEVAHAIGYYELGLGTVDTICIGGRGGEVSLSAELTKIQHEEGITHLIACLLAGRVAEQRVLGRASVGAGGSADSDLGRATQIALEAETAFGFGSDMPLIYRPPTGAADLLHYNLDLAQRINARLETAEATIRGVLEKHHDALIALAKQLVEVRVLEGDVIRQALAQTISTGDETNPAQ